MPTGEKWTYKNRVSIQGSSQRAEAEDTYHSYKSFEKRVSANSDQDESGYQSGDQTYREAAALLYRMELEFDR